MKIVIIGYGHVGKATHKLFTKAVIFDELLGIGSKEETSNADVAFICVPTPSSKDGSCDASIVEEVISWINSKLIIIRSTINIGFTESMTNKYKKNIVFQPEYYGETVNHPFADIRNQNWITFGGNDFSIDLAIEVYKEVKNSNVRIIRGASKDIEMAKYMENAFLAMKVTFINEMYDIAKKMDVNYNVAREAWIADPRIGSSHTFVYKNNRGYGGKCLPKDVSSLVYQAKKNNVNVDFLESMIKKNKHYR